jgi:hypothetical protein
VPELDVMPWIRTRSGPEPPIRYATRCPYSLVSAFAIAGKAVVR